MIETADTRRLVPVEYQGSRGWCYVDAGRAYVLWRPGERHSHAQRPDPEATEVTHGATLTVSRRYRGARDGVRIRALLAQVPHLQVEIVEVGEVVQQRHWRWQSGR